MNPTIAFQAEDGVEIEVGPRAGTVDDATVIANCASALKRGLPEMAAEEPHDGGVAIVAGGPSIRHFGDEIAARKAAGTAVWACNAVHGWLAERGVAPDAAWLLDGRESNAGFFTPPVPGCTYWLAARCAPKAFDNLAGQDVRLWFDTQSIGVIPPRPGRVFLGGGGTVGMMALCGAFTLGYRAVHLYGFDSSFDDGEHHAYRQPLNDADEVYDCAVAGMKFRAAGWMIGQVKAFGILAPELVARGCHIELHGGGLLPAAEFARQAGPECFRA